MNIYSGTGLEDTLERDTGVILDLKQELHRNAQASMTKCFTSEPRSKWSNCRLAGGTLLQGRLFEGLILSIVQEKAIVCHLQ